jgi:hypothetical protein
MMVRVAGAPVIWGICEVPDWDHQMRRVDVASTSFGYLVCAPIAEAVGA